MENSLKIPKNPVYPPSMDFQLLRREGIRHIERMGSAIWTDYNLHDPGITILEVLCYALTDLGYRANLPASDLFATEPGRHPFPTAAEILPTGPVTAPDIRKLIIDLPGVHNAWVSARQEPEVLVRLKETLNSNQVNANYQGFNGQIEEELRKFLTEKGLELGNVTKILVDSLTDFNLGNIPVDVELTKGVTETISLTKCLTKWYDNLNGCHSDVARKYEIAFFEGLSIKLFEPIFLTDTTIADDLKTKALQKVAQHPQIQKLFGQLLLNNIEGILGDPETASITPPDPKNPNYSLYITQGIYKFYVELEEDCDESEIRAAILARLHPYRNLGEDFDPAIEFLQKIPVAIEATIELTPDAQADEVLPLLYQAIGEYLSPTLRFYTLEEMMNRHAVFTLTDLTLARLTAAQLPQAAQTALKTLLNQPFRGKDTLAKALAQALNNPDLLADYETLIFFHTDKSYDSDPVYRGPLLTHGFLDEAELDAAKLRQTAYKSDLYQRMLQVSGVVAIQKMKLDKCHHEEGQEHGILHDHWCLSCGCSCLHTLDLDCSDISFTKGNLPLLLRDWQKEQARERYDQLRVQHSPLDQRGQLDLSLPAGQFRPGLTEFTSIQEDFPLTYHVGRDGIARNEPAQRQAQVKQLKAYLLFYDQLLANYLAHLGEVRNVLAIDKPGQPIKPYQMPDVPGLHTLLKQADPHGYEQALAQLANGNEIDQLLARNRILDHLLARFGEQFTDYALQYFPIEKPAESNPYGDLTDWIAQKETFLRDMPALGGRRATGFNYRATPQLDNLHVWQSANISGLERRVRAGLSMTRSPLERMPLADEMGPLLNPGFDWTRHPIAPESKFVAEVFPEQIGRRPRFRFGVKANADDVDYLLVSVAYFARFEHAETFGQTFLNQATDASLYDLTKTAPWLVNFTIKDELLMQSPMAFPRKEEADEELRRIKALASGQGQDDSFHLIEHILLRPRDAEYTLLQPSAVPGVPPLSRLDPYSFQFTVVVPNWVKRFSDDRLFAQFKQTLRLETPAHLFPIIRKYSQAAMRDVESAYVNWLIVSSHPEPEPADLREATNKLIDLLNKP